MNLKELASKLGLSQTTGSRALNGYPEVSEATRKLVVEAARLYGYAPNTRAKALATGNTHCIGHIIPVSEKREMVNPIFGDFMAGAGEVYAQNGFEMIVTMVEEDQEDALYRSCRTRKSVDGVVVQAPRMLDHRLGLLSDIGLPFVVHGRASSFDAPYSWLDVNNRSAFRRAARFLLDLGHRRIALINGLEHMDFAYRRRRGYEDALTAQGIASDPDIMSTSEMTEGNGYANATRMLGLPKPPSAFLVSSMIETVGVRRAVEERGLVMGSDVSIVTYDDCLSYLQNGAETPIFTATRSSVREAGKELAQMLIERIRNPQSIPQNRLLEAELLVGSSTGPFKATS